MDGWMCAFFFAFKMRRSEQEREAGCGGVMDGCLSSPPPGCPPPSGREWSGALHHSCLRGKILQQLMGDRATISAAAAAAATSVSYMRSASEWVFTGTAPSSFRFVTKGATSTISVLPHNYFGTGAVLVLCPRVILKQAWETRLKPLRHLFIFTNFRQNRISNTKEPLT